MAREIKGTEQFDVDGLRQLLELMEKYDVREYRQQRGDTRYVLRRGLQATAAAPVQYLPAAAPVAAPAPASVGAPAAAAPAAAPASDEKFIEIKSPTVGTFYQAPSPGEPAFVKVGDTVSPDTTVCIVEAMKLFNKIPSKVSGTIAKILLTDGDAVEYGQALYLVKP
ncbi:acetyl-CoA carboxylase biotin carboxyl carrier protein [Planctomicrobium piriforme]|uniref:Biotin carboxyl carrier protein of acetyl-CoA carboxylase n=1 Tax=Planctomicrobium piriforme TaxID=1576369 RepID=A0A1I3IHZ3_9PLAN|nr:acetyl-CoA carboxylase biotin carboxyl carrier protein [Planctomicrobium piriforme]SFI47520.1 acetyl-CoA carboxylase biotin carboxyl carrier protein [Planctomicrobium piriforme]